MACVALTSLRATIELEFLHPSHRVSLLHDDEKPLKSLFQKLSSLEAFLKKEYSNGDAPIRDLQIKIRDFALKAEDVIEIQIRNILRLVPKDGGEHQQKAADEELHRTLQQVAKDADELLMEIISNEVEEPASGGSIDYQQFSPQFEDIIMGGHRRFFRTIVEDYLLDSDSNLVVSILGVPGIGKTTFCKKVCADVDVVSYFDVRGWVTIPPRYNGNVQQLLCHLLQSISPTLTLNQNEMGSTVSQLKDQLHKHLKCKRYLIVLDDVPNTLLWDDIQQCFPDDSNGSLILLNTLFRDVVDYANSDYCFSLPFLSYDQSWYLFCHKLSHKHYCMRPEFKEIAERLVEECKGLPRSIVSVADRLSKCNYELKEWKKIEKELQSLGTLHKDTQHTSKLTHIYNRLPQHLKVYLLYFGVFPKHSEIRVERLIKLWIAEGFVKPLRSESLEDTAYKYLWDLKHKNLVTIVDAFRLRPKTCWIHIDMHSFCVRQAQKEGLLCPVNTQQCVGGSLDMLANSCRWLSLRSHSLDYHVLFSSNISRSLFFFQGYFERFVPFKHLRILEFSQSLLLKRVPLPLGGLVFLRYLSVPQWFESLDDVVSTNSNLQTLIVSGIDQSAVGAPITTRHLTSKIWELQHLRHLELGDMYMVDPPNMVKEHLETLVCAMPIHFRKEVVYYCKFPSIRKLKVVYKDVSVPDCIGGCCGNPIMILENLEDLLRLETLRVMVPVGSITLLERLGFPANLKELRLSGTNFPVKVLTVIGKLPKLEVLKLENALNGRVWEVVEGGFRELKKLEVEARSLEQWVVSSSHFPNLQHIFLKHCYSLEAISFVKAKHSTWSWLRSIKLERCPPYVVTSAKRIQKELAPYRDVGPHIIVDGKVFRFWNLIALMATPSTTPALFGGGLLGYVMYDVTHYYLHHRQPTSEVPKSLKKYHLNHHFRIQNKGFDITSALWDRASINVSQEE